MQKSITNIIEEKHAGVKHALGNVLWVFFRDVKRIFKKPVLFVVLLCALILPCLYAWLTVWASWDPYGVTRNLKIEFVNQDSGVDSQIGGHLALGDTLEEQLKTNDQLGWEFTDKDTAMRNVESGQAYAAIIIPKTFSAEIANIFVNPDIRDFVKVDYYVNERENGPAVKVADTGASTIEGQINEKFVAMVTKVISEKTVELTSAINTEVITGKETLASRIGRLATNIDGLSGVMNQGKGTISQAKETISLTSKTVSDIKQQSDEVLDKVHKTKEACDNVRSNIGNLIEELEKLPLEPHVLISILSNFESSLSDVSSGLTEISGVLSKVSFTCEGVISDLADADSMLDVSTSVVDDFNKKIIKVRDVLISLSGTISANLTSAPKLVKDIMSADSESIGNFISKPVNLDTEVINKIENNGTAISPFFTNLSIWVLGIVLIAIFRTEVEPPKKRKGWNAKQAFLSRGMLFSSCGLLAGIFVSCGNLYMLGIQCENPALYILSCMFIAFVYVNIIYTLAACFKHVGRAAACILVIMQIPGSSGMFPIQLMPQGFQNIFPFLPFTYGINALRECIISIDYLYWSLDLLALLIFFAIMLLIGVFAREHLVSVNKLFDEELAKNTIMICDAEDHVKQQEDAVTNVVENLNNNNDAIKVVGALDLVRKIYKRKSLIGLLALMFIPTLFLIIMSIIASFIDVDVNTKLTWMSIWMLLAIGISSYVIIIEHKYKKYKFQEKLTSKKAEQLNSEVVSFKPRVDLW